MTPFQIVACTVWLALFLVGGFAYAAGWYLQRSALKKKGEFILFAWLVCDLVLVVGAFTLGWLR